MLLDKHFRHLADEVVDYAIYFLDEIGTILSWNEGATKAKGYRGDEVIGQNYAMFYSDSDRTNGLPQRNLNIARTEGRFSEEGWRFRRDGSGFWASVVIHPIHDEERRFIGFAKITRDLTSQHATEHRLLQKAMRDSLTGLFNRAAFLDRLEQEIAQVYYGSPVALHYIDLDRFKPINDAFGHLAGDKVLQEVASRLKCVAGSQSLIARLGGDEFAILQCGSPTEAEAEALAQAVVDRLREPYAVRNATVTIGASVGVAHAPSHGLEAETLIRNADLALYKAKQDGRNSYKVFNACLGEKAISRDVIELKLRHALKSFDFDLHYQPIVDARTQRLSGFEALLRWRDREGRTISPAEFIPVAEELGVMPELGAWVLRKACGEAVGWDEALTIAVNVSATQLCNIGFVGIVKDALRASGLAASRLELEITETAILVDQELASSILHSIRELGVSIALDDFGTGFSSLSMVASLPLTRIKIDRSFVKGIDGTKRSTSVIRAVSLLCEGYGFSMTAEGVETAEQAAILEQHGCNELQGYLFGKPQPAEYWHLAVTASTISAAAE